MSGEMFYLQDRRSYCGNDMLFWRLGGGYTTDVRHAEIFTREKAFRQHGQRTSDLPWPKEYIDSHTRPAVDHQHCDYFEAMKEPA